MSSGEISGDRFPLVTILLLKAMKGMETARVGMRESRKEMRRAVPADNVTPVVSLLLVDDDAADATDNAEETAGEMKNLSVSAEVMATGLERTVLTLSSVS